MSLQVWLPLTQGTGIQNQGLSDANFKSSGITLNTNDGMGSCYSCAGSGYVVSDKKIYLGKEQSMFCWVKLNSFNSSSSLTGICGQHRYNSCRGMGINLIYASATTGYLGVSTGNGNSRTYKDYKGQILLTAGNWYHVGYTYDGATIRLYVNGVLDKEYSFSNMNVPEDYFQAFQWSLDTSNTGGVQGGYAMNGYLNDVRAYDHVLSLKEIKELAKGLMLHYTFNRGDYNAITNLLTTPVPGSSITASYAWDKTLHPRAIAVSGWSTGYNGGVKGSDGVVNAQYGYHAHWENIDGIATMVFPKLNYSVTEGAMTANRWLGISTSTSVASTLKAGTTYTVSFEAMADTEGMLIYGGYYYNSTFPDGSFYAKKIPVGKWKRYSFTLTVKNTVSSGGTFYFYGHDSSSANGISYLRNPQVEVGAICNDYIEGTKAKETIIYDSSGFSHDGVITGTLSSAQSNTNTTINGSTTRNYENKNYSAYFNGSSYVCYDTEMIIPTNYTLAFWFNKTANAKHIIDWRSRTGETGIQPVYLNADGTIQYYTNTTGSTNFSYVFNNNTWYHVAIAVNPSSATLYVNGTQQQTVTQTVPASKGAFHVGCRVSYTNIPTMYMKDLRVYRTTLNAADIKQLYHKPLMIDKDYNIFTKELKEGSGA